MKKLLPLVFLLLLLLSSCKHQNKGNEYNKSDDYHVAYETEENDGEVFYKTEGKKYKYLLKLSGRSNNAAQDTYYIVLSNNKKINFEDADKRYFGSDLSDNEDFFIVGSGTVEETT